jgi:hypothetical protein
MRKALLAAAAVLVAALALACNGDDDNGGGGSTPTRPPATPAAATATPDPGAIDSRPGGTAPVSVQSIPSPLSGVVTQTAVRIGLHPEQGGWDRIVLEFDRGIPPAEISYVDQAVACGSGEPVAVQGQAILSVRMTTAQAHNDAGNATTPRQLPGQGGVIQEALVYCDFEAHVDWAIGLRARNNFKITTLSNPPRLVVDIKQ